MKASKTYRQEFVVKQYDQDDQKVMVIGSHDAWAWIEECEISLDMLLVGITEDMPPLVITAAEYDGVKIITIVTQGDLPL